METQPEKTFFDRLRQTVGGKFRDASRTAVGTYRTIAARMQKSVSGNELMGDRDRLRPMIMPQEIGRLCMFFYDPKTKDDLPYYDRFPLVIPVEMYSDGFLGMNLHYLPAGYRARLMDQLYDTIYKNKYMDEKKRVRVSFGIMNSVARNKYFVPCTKRYLYSHLRSRIYVLDPKDWNMALFLPTERFAKADKKTVHQESVATIRKARYR